MDVITRPRKETACEAELKIAGATWEAWLKRHCPKIADSTDRVYRRFAKDCENLDELAGGADALAVLGEAKQARRLILRYGRPMTSMPSLKA
jgi:hypothetical protein